jgi:protein-tyrosine phosphatase
MKRFLVPLFLTGAVVCYCLYFTHIEAFLTRSFYAIVFPGQRKVFGSDLVSKEESASIRKRSEVWKRSSCDLYNDADHIIDNVYLGNVCAAHDEEWLVAKRISAVINMAVEWVDKDITYMGIEYLPFAMEDVSSLDHESTDRHIERATQELISLAKRKEQTGENVLVHCNMGISRSASVVIRYLQQIHKMTYKEAFLYTRRKRPVVRPNSLFERILCKGEKSDIEEQKDAFRRNRART